MRIKEKLEKYINNNLEAVGLLCESSFLRDTIPKRARVSINDYIDSNKEDSFQLKLFELIDKKGLKDSDVYNKANIDRRLFSKIRSNKDYHPSKETIILLGLSLELSESEIEELLKSASYSLPKNNTFDLIIRFCFMENIYDINQVNEFLYDHNCKTLV